MMRTVSKRETFTRNGVECVLDPCRNRLIKLTPEEQVRQETVEWLEKVLRVPIKQMETEYNHRRHAGSGRSDILVRNSGQAVLVVECKRPGTPLDNSVRDQGIRYAEQVAAPYLFLINGSEKDVFSFTKGQGWSRSVEIPTWEEMLSRKRLKPQEAIDLGSRWPFEHFGTRSAMKARMREKNTILDSIVAKKSEWFVAQVACNLWDLLVFDDQVDLPMSRFGITIKKDLGLNYRTFGNAGGGSYPSEVYRSFLVNDEESDQVVSLLVCANVAGSTKFIVAVDDGPTSHLSLQATLDNTFTEDDVLSGEVNLSHNADLTAGASGRKPRAKVLAFVRDKVPSLVAGDHINLGRFPTNDLAVWSDKRIQDMLLRTVKYALVRDAFRASL